jgi:hypothetical protein
MKGVMMTLTGDGESQANTNEAMVDEILADIRTEVLKVPVCGPDIDRAFQGALSNAQAAVRIYRERSIRTSGCGTAPAIWSWLSPACNSIFRPEKERRNSSETVL